MGDEPIQAGAGWIYLVNPNCNYVRVYIDVGIHVYTRYCLLRLPPTAQGGETKSEISLTNESKQEQVGYIYIYLHIYI